MATGPDPEQLSVIPVGRLGRLLQLLVYLVQQFFCSLRMSLQIPFIRLLSSVYLLVSVRM